MFQVKKFKRNISGEVIFFMSNFSQILMTRPLGYKNNKIYFHVCQPHSLTDRCYFVLEAAWWIKRLSKSEHSEDKTKIQGGTYHLLNSKGASYT